MRTARLRTLLFAAAYLLLCWMVFSRSYLNPVPFPLVNADEQGHFSYTEYLLQHGTPWPDFAQFPLYDTTTRAAVSEPNFINHPPLFYWVAAALHHYWPQHDPINYRLPMVLLFALFMALYFRLGQCSHLPLLPAFAYALLPFLLRVELTGGMYSNDAFAFIGGALACLGSHHRLAGRAARGHGLMLAGLCLAAVKLTALLLVGLYVTCVVLQARGGLRLLSRARVLGGAALLAACCAPYVYFIYRFGSPAPNTPGQLYMLTHRFAPTAPEMDVGSWLLRFMADLADQASGPELTGVALLWLVAAALLVRTPLARAAVVSTLCVGAAHLVFSWQRYTAYGWLHDAALRYYFPLLPAYGMMLADSISRIRQSSHAA